MDLTDSAKAPKPEVHKTETSPNPTFNPVERTNKYLWYLRFIQIIFAVTIVAIAGSNISDWHSYGCSSPSGLSFNFAIALLTLLLTLYLVLSTGPSAKIPWYSFIAILSLEILFIIFWIVAAALAGYDCTSLCNACSAIDQGTGYYVWANDLICFCWTDYDNVSFKRDSPEAIFRRGSRPASSSDAAAAGKTLEKGVSKAAKQGLDAAMILLFITSLITLLQLRYSKKGTANVDHEAERVDQHVENTFKMEFVGPSA
ncbi:uncharacterized protein LY89DRAFT_684442, partial [Mollisia scopiformis]